MRRWIVLVTAAVLAAGIYIVTAVRAEDEPAATTEAVAPKRAPATISAAAKVELDAIDKAYAELKGAKLAGSLSLDADVSGQTRKTDAPFESTFAAPNLFRHASKDDVVSGYTGENAFVFLPRRNIYLSKAVPREKVTEAGLPETINNVLTSQNPSLLMAISKEPSAALGRGYASIDKGTDVDVDGVPHTTLVMKSDSEVATVLVDPKTHLIRRFVSDLRPLMIARGADAVNKAEFVVDYSTVTPDTGAAADAFAWVAPDGARDVTNNMQELGSGDAASQAMVGKPAPDFTLPALNGPPIKLSDAKGSVVVLDFWATWCAPCIMSLPELNTFYEQTKDKPVKVIGINGGEDKPDVVAFVERHKLTFPMALDADGAVNESFAVNGFPTTVIIDKEGIIRKVINGYAPGRTGREIERTVEELSK